MDQDLNDICYNKNYLKEVIVRVDFLQKFPDINKSLPIKFTREVNSIFPIAEPKNIIARNLQISQKDVKTDQFELKEWNFFSKDRSKKLTISEQSFFIIYYAYNTFENFQKDFIRTFSSYMDVFKTQQPSRLGLRYINNFLFKEPDPLDWAQYFNPHLLSSFQFYSDKKAISQIFQSLELNLDSFNLRFQYGMPNPDYPAAIKKKLFVLDFDAYYKGLQEQNDILKQY